MRGAGRRAAPFDASALAATGFTLTAPDGQYAFCGYWDDYGQTVRVSKGQYRTSFQEIADWRNDVVLVPETSVLSLTN